VEGSREHGNRPSGAINDGGLLDYVSNFLKMELDSTAKLKVNFGVRIFSKHILFCLFTSLGKGKGKGKVVPVL
jgi:hypothetical protein